eukprot:m.37842 g.37842  ORF g.37842 m.37842 type:complete len:87 (-) comp11435_c0_seq2:1235-1495(-)
MLIGTLAFALDILHAVPLTLSIFYLSLVIYFFLFVISLFLFLPLSSSSMFPRWVSCHPFFLLVLFLFFLICLPTCPYCGTTTGLCT